MIPMVMDFGPCQVVNYNISAFDWHRWLYATPEGLNTQWLEAQFWNFDRSSNDYKIADTLIVKWICGDKMQKSSDRR